MKKFRGKRRYFRTMWAQIAETDLAIDEHSWFAFKHFHLDFWGYGKNSGILRRAHVKGHIALLDEVIEQLEQAQMPYQAWINLNEKYPEYDAVYIHSDNPYDAFPYKSAYSQETTTLPAMYRDLIDLTKYRVALSTSDDQVCYCLQVKGKGMPV